MSCKKDQKPCDAESPICRLNPDKEDAYYYDEMTGEKRIFFNKRCSSFYKG